MKFTSIAVLAALLAAGAAQAQLKMPTPAPDASAPASAAPPAGRAQAPAGGPPGGNGAAPNMPDPLTPEFRACIQKVQEAAQQAKLADPGAAQACFTAETRRQEGKISAGVQRISKGLSANEKKHFDESNVAWRRFRDSECAFFAEPKGSPVEAANNAQCTLDRTIKRALDMDGLSMALAERDAAKNAPPPANAPAPAAPAAPAKK